ncbi:MAG: 4Fe-4S dicluster domain-containing protein [Pseudomonadota bacterium]
MSRSRATIPIISVQNADRRRFLQLLAASAALSGAGCSGPPAEAIVPYVDMPENVVPGAPVFYATAFVRRGFAHGVLVEIHLGRPTKVEGNPGHPVSGGATDVFAQASVLQLWDPERSQAVRLDGQPSSWGTFAGALNARRAQYDKNGGAGLRIVTGAVTSPTLAAQLQALLRKYPNASWHAAEPLHDDGAAAAAGLAFGRPLDTLYRLERAAVVLTLDADLFGDWPGAIANARAFSASRRLGAAPGANRLYAMEAGASITGAFADERLARAPRHIERALWRIAARLGVTPAAGAAPDQASERWERAVARALAEQRGKGVVAAGPSLSPAARALVHKLNVMLGNTGQTVLHIDPVAASTPAHVDSIAALARAMHAGQVDSLLMLDANPAYSAPAELDFARALRRVPFSAHLGLYRDETARLSHWHLPLTHAFEHWSDARAHDGTASIVQPLIAPLYDGRSSHALLAMLLGGGAQDGYALVRGHWQQQAGEPFDQFWQESLRTGVIVGSAATPVDVKAAAAIAPPAPAADGIEVIFAADPCVDGGEFSNNGWLQELPRPLTSLTWDNAALLGPATAQRHGLATGDIVRVTLAGRFVDAAVYVSQEQAEDTLILPLGYGRRAGGAVGEGVGFDAYRLRTAAALGGRLRAALVRTGAHHQLALRQQEVDMHGRDIVRFADLATFAQQSGFAHALKREQAPDVSLYPSMPYKDYKWGMAIDLNACIGCGTCTIACQAENNIPVVGKEEVLRGRIMHWIRVDRYRARGRTLFQPVPCMHCEKAPCEEVCPVGATMHDSEGLNVQVYNRCVGTRFCSNNCPYKVRRFNFLQYSPTNSEQRKALQNPDVTVRQRGVMEKCTYCLQRITAARIDAEKLGRPIADGELVTACQAACPTRAIVFGNLNDPGSEVSKAKQVTLDYALLAELNTAPRTTYTARVINPDPELE